MAAARALLIQRVAVTNGSRAMAARRMTVCVMRVLTSHNAHGIKFAVAAAAIHPYGRRHQVPLKSSKVFHSTAVRHRLEKDKWLPREKLAFH